jgi:hypothetical protein
MVLNPELALALRYGMALVLFVMGLAACIAGMWTLLAQGTGRTLRGISEQSHRLHARALGELTVGPMIDASARLVEAINQLVRTAMGIGAFLCLIGIALCLIAYWIFMA